MLCSFAIQRMMPSFSGVWRLSERRDGHARPLHRFDDYPDGAREPPPTIEFRFKLLAAGCRKRIELRAAIVLGIFPFRFDPPLMFKAMQGGIQRALLNLKNIV